MINLEKSGTPSVWPTDSLPNTTSATTTTSISTPQPDSVTDVSITAPKPDDSLNHISTKQENVVQGNQLKTMYRISKNAPSILKTTLFPLKFARL